MIISGDPPDDLTNHHRRIYPGRQSLPLTDEGVEAFREASRDGDNRDRLIGEGLILTGLKQGTFAHMTGEWLEWEEGNLLIRIPGGKFKCTVSPGRRGRTRAGGGEACKHCKQNHDGYFSLNGTLQPRRVPVPEDEFAEFLNSYFQMHDRVCTPGTVNYRVKEIGKRAGFEKRVSPENLRMTFGKMLAEKGFKGEIIRRIMGFPDAHEGRVLTQRYFILSQEHSNPPYRCGKETESSDSCQSKVFFPDSTCERH